MADKKVRYINLNNQILSLGGDGILSFDTIDQMVQEPVATLSEGAIAWVNDPAVHKYFQYLSENTIDENLGRWKELVFGTDFQIFEYVDPNSEKYVGRIIQYCGETDTSTGFIKGCFYESRLTDKIDYVVVTLSEDAVGTYYTKDDEGNYSPITFNGTGENFDPDEIYYTKQEISLYNWVYINSLKVESVLDLNSQNAISNGAVTAKFEEVIQDYTDKNEELKEYVDTDVTTALQQYADDLIADVEEVTEDKVWSNSKTKDYVDTALEDYTTSATEILQAEYDALDEETKLANNYHCTDTGRMYYRGILYGDKKPIELTYEEYKTLEEAGLVETDVDYIVKSNESGVLLGSEDISYKDKTVHEALVTLEEDVLTAKDEIANKSLPNIYSVTTDFDYITHYCLKDVLKVSNDRELTLLLLTRGGEEMRIVIGKDNTTYKINAYKTVENYNKILNVYSYNDTDLYITLATYSNFLKVYLMSGEISDTFSGQNIGRTLPDGVVEIPIIKNALASDITSTYLIKDIAAGGENEKTVSFKIRKDYFASYYAKRTFLLSVNIYSLGFSKPVIGLVEIFRSSADVYSGYVVNLQDSRYTGVTVTVNGDYLEVVVTFNSYESSGCMVSCSSLSNIPIA